MFQYSVVTLSVSGFLQLLVGQNEVCSTDCPPCLLDNSPQPYKINFFPCFLKRTDCSPPLLPKLTIFSFSLVLLPLFMEKRLLDLVSKWNSFELDS